MPDDARDAALIRRYRAGGGIALRDRVFLENLEIVRNEVGRFLLHVPPAVERGDLEAAAAAGLLQALERYDPDSGVPFRFFAARRVRGAILDELRRMDLLGRDTRHRIEAIRQAERRLRNSGADPTAEEIARAAGISYDEYVDAELALHASQLARITPPADDMPLAPIPSEAPPPHQAVENQELVNRALQLLSEREKVLVALHYYEGLTLREIARLMRLSEGRVSQIHADMLSRLRRKLS